MRSISDQLDIFEYDNYREFLRDFYESKKKTAEKVSFRQLARISGFGSPSFLKMVIEGKRNLSQDSIQKLMQALRFNKEETQYFTNLVFLNQATGIDDKRHYAEQLLRSRNYRKRNPLKSTQFDYYTSWYYIAVRELVATKGFQEDPEWIATVLKPSITVAEAKAALDDLLKLNLIQRNSEGRLEQTQRALVTEDNVDAVSVGQFHREMIRKGAESIELFPQSERDIAALTFGTGPETARQIRELARKMRDEMVAILLNSKEDATDVYQLNFQYFPLSQTLKKKGEKK